MKADRLQFIGLLVAVAAIVSIGIWQQQQPEDANELRIPVEELHSQAAELVLLETEGESGQLRARFMQWHAAQLGHNVQTSLHQLQQMHPQPKFAAMQTEAERDGAELLSQVRTVHADRPPGRAAGERIRDRLGSVARQLRP